jgi:hypothetical protein
VRFYVFIPAHFSHYTPHNYADKHTTKARQPQKKNTLFADASHEKRKDASPSNT